MSWPVFIGVCAALLLFGLLVVLGGHRDEQRWRRAREAEEAARRAAE